MSKRSNKSTIALWFVTGFSILLAYVTYGIEFRRRNISVESIEGAVVFGFILFLYLCWFIYDTFVSEQGITITGAIKYNLKNNPAVWAMYCYFFVFILLPLLLYLNINNL